MTKVKAPMTSEAPSPAGRVGTKPKVCDLEERTAQFGESVIEFVKRLAKDDVNRVLVGQVVRSAASIGANYAEADGALTKKDFRHKIGICLRESEETRHWLRMLAKANPNDRNGLRPLWRASQELTLIFGAILSPGKE